MSVSHSDLMRSLPAWLQMAGRVISAAGYQCYLVGGALRNILLDEAHTDYDLATDATPSTIRELFPRTIPTGIAFGTITVLWRGHTLEITTMRSEGEYTDNRHPSAVTFGNDITQDLQRRDFTMNALALDLSTGALHDPFHGQQDIHNRIIRTVGSPGMRFREDALRMIRAIRIAGEYDCTIEQETFAAIIAHSSAIRSVAKERIGMEIIKIIGSMRCMQGMHHLITCGHIDHIARWNRWMRQAIDRIRHNGDILLQHSAAYRALPASPPTARMAALLYILLSAAQCMPRDIESALQATCNDMVGFALGKQLLGDAQRIAAPLIRGIPDERTDSDLRILLAGIGKEHARIMLSICSSLHIQHISSSMRHRLQACYTAQRIYSMHDLAINGDTLIRHGFQAGKELGALLDDLLRYALINPQKNSEQELLKYARHHNHAHPKI